MDHLCVICTITSWTCICTDLCDMTGYKSIFKQRGFFPWWAVHQRSSYAPLSLFVISNSGPIWDEGMPGICCPAHTLIDLCHKT